jgi:hypothetical protein
MCCACDCHVLPMCRSTALFVIPASLALVFVLTFINVTPAVEATSLLLRPLLSHLLNLLLLLLISSTVSLALISLSLLSNAQPQ